MIRLPRPSGNVEALAFGWLAGGVMTMTRETALGTKRMST
jgi:hypothetical protein